MKNKLKDITDNIRLFLMLFRIFPVFLFKVVQYFIFSIQKSMMFQDISNPQVKLFYSACGIITSITSSLGLSNSDKGETKVQNNEPVNSREKDSVSHITPDEKKD